MTGYHEAHFAPDPRRDVVWRAISAHLAHYVPADGAVLELGAGYCHWINHVTAARRVAADIWPGVAAHAAPGVETAVVDVSKGLGALEGRRFDVVLASNLLEHLTHDEIPVLLDAVRRALTPGGRFLIVQPNFRFAFRRYFDDFTHRAVYTDVSLPALLRSRGFVIDTVHPRFAPYSMQGRRVPTPEWVVRAYLASPWKPGAGQMFVAARRPDGT